MSGELLAILIGAVGGGTGLAAILKELGGLKHQFKNNGGSSMRDRIDAIERRLDAGTERFDRMEHTVKTTIEKHEHTMNQLAGDVRELMGYIRGIEK